MENRILNSETKQFKVIFPNTLNDHNTLFGGIAMQWMDEVAYITAVRFARCKMVTVSVENIKFLAPINSGCIAEINGKIIKPGCVKVKILVEIFTENMLTHKREKAVDAIFTFAAVNDKNKPIPIDFVKKSFNSHHHN